MIADPRRYRELHYKGNKTGPESDLLGKVMGPTTVHELLTCYHVEYDPETDITTAHMRPTTQEDMDAST